jgi:hypothetical protein
VHTAFVKFSRFTLLVTCVVWSYIAAGQKDSTSAVHILLPNISGTDTIEIDYQHPMLLHRYDSLQNQLSIGNFGSRTLPLSLAPTSKPTFGLFMLQDVNRFDSLIWLFSSIPFIEVRYCVGFGNEQNLMVTHARRVAKNTSITLRYNKIKTKGFLARQSLDNDQLSGSFHHANQGGNYKAYGGIIFSRFRRRENGGIRSDTAFQDLGFGNKELLEVRYANATVEYASLTAEFNQEFRLNSAIKLTHNLRFTDRVRSFYDTRLDTVLYPNYIWNPNETFNLIKERSIINNVGVQLVAQKFRLQGDYVVQWAQYDIRQNVGNILNQGFSTQLFLPVNKALQIEGNGLYWFAGYNQNDHHLNASVDWNPDSSNIRVQAEVRSTSLTPSPDLLLFTSNTFQWVNQFNRTHTLRANGMAQLKKQGTSFQVEFTNFNNLIYFDSEALPQQIQSVQVGGASVRQNIDHKRFHLRGQVYWQSVLNTDVVRLPELRADISFWWQVGLFKGKMPSLIGFEAFWFSKYNAYAYEPATDAFYLQNEQAIGNFPYVSVFLNARVSQAAFFVKASHLTSFIMPNNYYGAYLHPLAPFSVRLGISWQFWN